MKTSFLIIPFITLFSCAFADEIKWAGMLKLEANDAYCFPEEQKGRDEYLACLKDAQVLTHKLYEQPDESSKYLGLLKVIAGSKDKADMKWIKPDGSSVDLKIDGEIGYRSLNQFSNSHTYIGCKGHWYKLPRNPFPVPVWTKMKFQCDETTGFNESKLKWDLVATEVGTNRKVILPAGKMLVTTYEGGKVILSEYYRKSDIRNDHPRVREVLKMETEYKHSSKEKTEYALEAERAAIVEEYKDKQIFKSKYVLEMKDFLDKDSHLPLAWADEDKPQIPTRYLDEEKKGQEKPKK